MPLRGENKSVYFPPQLRLPTIEIVYSHTAGVPAFPCWGKEISLRELEIVVCPFGVKINPYISRHSFGYPRLKSFIRTPQVCLPSPLGKGDRLRAE